MKIKIWFVWLIPVAMILSGFMACDIINPDEPIPATIHLSPFQFNIEPGQGTANNRITEVWVYANGNNLGTFAPPVDIRYLESGPTTFVFHPGIRNNGILGDAIIYPLFDSYSIEIDAQPDSSYTIHPVTAYKAGTVFSMFSDFELANDFTYNRDTLSSTNVIRSQADVFEGQYSGEIVLTKEANYIEVGNSLSLINLPVNGKPIYLEMRYKSETQISIGLLGQDLGGNSYSNFFYILKPSDDWNMLYLELTDPVKNSQFPSYRILFQAIYPASETRSELHIFLDNIKVVHL